MLFYHFKLKLFDKYRLHAGLSNYYRKTQIRSAECRLNEYILVSQHKVNVERYFRNTDEWIFSYYQELDLQLPLTSIQCEVPLQEIYDSVTFPD